MFERSRKMRRLFCRIREVVCREKPFGWEADEADGALGESQPGEEEIDRPTRRG
jgi:hypothetical protein